MAELHYHARHSGISEGAPYEQRADAAALVSTYLSIADGMRLRVDGDRATDGPFTVYFPKGTPDVITVEACTQDDCPPSLSSHVPSR